MSQSLNKIMLIGRLGRDAETRFTANDNAVTSFSVATDHGYKGKDGNWANETTWHNIISWNPSDYLKAALVKGRPVYVEGRLTRRDYTDKEGAKRFNVEVVAEKIIPLAKGERADEYADPDTYKQEDIPAEDNGDLPF